MSSPKINCPKCIKIVNDGSESICCDICDSWYHLKCYQLSKKSFECFLIDKDLKWFCANCLRIALPFQTLSDTSLRNHLNTPCESDANVNFLNTLLSSPEGFKKVCAVCNRKVRIIKNTIPCQECKCLIHHKCSRLQPWQSASLSKVFKYWCCQTCFESKFPFVKLNDFDLLDLTFNSNFECPCQKKCTNVDNQEILETLDLCKLTLSEHDLLCENDINNHVNFHSNFDFYTIHKFHKLIRNISFKKEEQLSLMHTNNSSLLGNVEKLKDLLVDLVFDFDIIALSETWHTKAINDRFKNLSIPGFHGYNGLEGNSKSGGCGFVLQIT